MTAAAPQQPISFLARPVTTLYGVGPERAAQLARLEIATVEDLLLHRPRRYEDRRHLRPIAELQLHEPAIVHGTVVALGVKWYQQHTRSIFELILDDGTARLHCRWWNLPFMEKYFAMGDEVVVFGKPLGLKPRTIDHPETEVIEAGEERSIHLSRITPIYPLTEGVPQRWLRALIWRTLQAAEPHIPEPWPELTGLITEEPLQVAGCGLQVSTKAVSGKEPPAMKLSAPVERQEELLQVTPEQASGTGQPATCNLQRVTTLPTRAQAIRLLHFPEEEYQANLARQRLALDEFIELQYQIQLRRKKFEAKAQALPCGGDNHLIKPFLAQLQFKLTAAQTRVLRELRKDMAGPHPMRRLLQGDVGSGKTAVAACCALMALESGYNVALMAPTEILAEQHYGTFTKWLQPLGIRIELQTGSTKTLEAQDSTPELPKTSARSAPNAPSSTEAAKEAQRAPASTLQPFNPPTLTIGTHALIESSFAPDNLGLVIIDEQHKFGVAQREQLLRKGRYPHLLVMTATPIPRTLGLTLYGELDVSVIDELPPGRGHIKTFVRAADKLPKVWEFIRSKLAEGRQAYVVYPRVEEAGNGVKAVTKEFENLQKILAPYQVGLLHGRLKSKDKEETMAAFRTGRLQVLLATSLIEVGVDVPNATIMLIENAEQFGLAQLHQLRGRIGRGAHDSYCILVATVKGKEAHQRLRALEQTTDGFQLAEADLKLRGPGELLGQQQSGLPRFRFGDLATDLALINRARELAGEALKR